MGAGRPLFNCVAMALARVAVPFALSPDKSPDKGSLGSTVENSRYREPAERSCSAPAFLNRTGSTRWTDMSPLGARHLFISLRYGGQAEATRQCSARWRSDHSDSERLDSNKVYADA